MSGDLKIERQTIPPSEQPIEKWAHEVVTAEFETDPERIALILGAEERARAALNRWLANPEFKAALHRHDPPAR